ncbi:hypothetical protein LEP1GSC050_0540 [Leptospira broomii serovar Hurstbridge str. 5399]|uniref:Uncharacterized protein n=1 Tax=Leptospira broomii serovar Hurstbridge str. 5399 TaxID=1049789 RepID=T0FGM4_9LEPT|nr:hypothetical protein [Leptospira broomii]EQA46772.1 hypothetical protein LEP1GSC050_0540 [Leptospira broomii serovar Hurstbridge str. 5399]
MPDWIPEKYSPELYSKNTFHTEMSGYFRALEDSSLRTFKERFDKIGRRMESIPLDNFSRFIRASGEELSNWQSTKEKMAEDYFSLQNNRRWELELALKNRRPSSTQEVNSSSNIVSQVWTSLWDGLNDWFSSSSRTADSGKKRMSASTDSVPDPDLANFLDEREKSFKKFHSLLESSALRLNKTYKIRFHKSLDLQIQKLKSEDRSYSQIRSSLEAAQNAANAHIPDKKIKDYSFFMMNKFYAIVFKQSKETDQTDAPVSKLSLNIQKTESTQPKEDLKICNITDLPPEIIKECEEDYIILNISTQEKKHRFHRALLETANVESRQHAEEFFSECKFQDKSVLALAKKIIARSDISLAERASLQKMIQVQESCSL